MLAVLLLEAPRVVPVSRLIEAAWDGAPPETAALRVRKTMAELRRRVPGGGALIVTADPGYRAVVAEEQLDVLRHARMLRDADAALEAGDTQRSAELLGGALRLWRGPVLAGEGGRVIDALAVPLQEQRLAAAERLYGLPAAEGADAASAVGELRALVEDHPLRETLRGRLMLALARAGQQAAALEEFRRFRRLLGEELGIDPGAELSRLHERILRQDPALIPPAVSGGLLLPGSPAAPATADGVGVGVGVGVEKLPVPPVPTAVPRDDTAAAGRPVPPGPPATGTVPGPAPVPRLLPYDIPDFAGRTADLDWIREAAGRGRGEPSTILGIDGMGGGGKTALVTRAAHELADHYAGGGLFLDLRGFTPAQEPLHPFHAQGELLVLAGVPGEEIPHTEAGRSALWRNHTRARPMLLVLDNAATSDQVRALIPASPGSLVLVTSRPRLTGLEGAEWRSIDALTDADGRDLLRRTLGEERLAREPDAVAELLRLCGGLPLALRIAAARLANRPHWTIGHFVGRLRDHDRRLDELTSEGKGVAGTLLLSYRSMPDRRRTAFRLLGLHPGRHIDLPEAAALLDLDAQEAEDVLEALVDVRLLESREPGTYSFHDLVHSFVRREAQEQDERESASRAVERLLDHYAQTATRACDLLLPGRAPLGAPGRGPERSATPPKDPAVRFSGTAQALRWLDRHRESLLASVELARDHGLLRHAARLPRELAFHAGIRGYDLAAHRALETGVAAARQLGDRALLCFNLTHLAMGKWRLGRLRESLSLLEEALELSRAAHDRLSEAECLARLAQTHNSLGELPSALRLGEQAHLIARQGGFTRLGGSSLSTLSHVRARLGQYARAARDAEDALGNFHTLGESPLSAEALLYLSQALALLGRYDEALGRADEAAELCGPRRVAPSVLPLVLAHRAELLECLGRPHEAAECAARALAEVAHCADDIHRAAVHLTVGGVFHARGEQEAALDQFTLGHDIARRMELRYERAHALYGLAAVHQANGDLPVAEKHRVEAAALRALMGIPDDTPAPSPSLPEVPAPRTSAD
jgi:DNA-binding SARP family transcriptional activator/tetratricopeptide (TPR) repeat protein